jgi:soluble lytic murein transglycosylase-like protein
VGIKNPKIARAVKVASRQSGLSEDFLIALLMSESTGREYSVSSKGYQGLMQIPFKVYYPDANLLIGAHIFNEKMRITKGNVEKALCLYKGYPIGSARGKQQARKVLAMCERLKEIV